MIHDPFILVAVLAGVEFFIIYLAANPSSKHLFKFIPSMFWIYFLPMVLSSVGVIDAKSPVYAGITKHLLPLALFLLLLKVDMKAISRMGPAALVMFFAGSCGIMLGIVISFVVFKPWVGRTYWSGFGALSASWTGGSANMIAVKEALGTPDAVFLPMVIVDTVLPYMWMGLLVALAHRQYLFDRWNHADRRILDELGKNCLTQEPQATRQSLTSPSFFLILGLAFIISLAAQALAPYLPTGHGTITTYAWTIILVSTTAIILSITSKSFFIPGAAAHQWGKWLLYFVLTSIGARATLHHAAQAGILILAGVLVLMIHAVILLLTARLIKAPLFLVATASLANIAGLASAPVVAEVYQPGLGGVGLLLAILGHSLGAYFGILTGQICRLFAR